MEMLLLLSAWIVHNDKRLSRSVSTCAMMLSMHGTIRSSCTLLPSIMYISFICLGVMVEAVEGDHGLLLVACRLLVYLVAIELRSSLQTPSSSIYKLLA